MFSLSRNYSECVTTLVYLVPGTCNGSVKKDQSVISCTLTITEQWTVQDVEYAIVTCLKEKILAESDIEWNQIFDATFNSGEQEKGPIQLNSVQLTTKSIGLDSGAGEIFWKALNLSCVKSVRCHHNSSAGFWSLENLIKLKQLERLDLSESLLSSLPPMVEHLLALEHLDISKNALSIIPKEIGNLKNLKKLIADDNCIAILPGELSRCQALETLSLRNNRLTHVLIQFQKLKNLNTLLLDGNPLESLPNIAGCKNLTTLSVVHVRVKSNFKYDNFDVAYIPQESSKSLVISFFESKKVNESQVFLNLALRGTSHHPLVIGAIRSILEISNNRTLVRENEEALQQLILMMLNDDFMVVSQACNALVVLAQHSTEMADMVVMKSWKMLMGMLSREAKLQIAALDVVNASGKLSESSWIYLNEGFLNWCLGILSADDCDNILKAKVFNTIGTLCLHHRCKEILSEIKEFENHAKEALKAKELKQESSNLQFAAIRFLASLGRVDQVSAVIGRPVEQERGIRILSLDGGGMKGLATIQMLRQIERQAGGRPLRDLFDLVVGTSTGALLTVALMLKGLSLTDCEKIYKDLGNRVFRNPVLNTEKDESWMNLFFKSFHSKTEHVRAVVVGCKHDTATYETLLKENCEITLNGLQKIEDLIDSACLDAPKIALVSTLTSVSPAQPFIFRNYEYPITSNLVSRNLGSSSHRIWEAVRASSAAIYYLDDFECNGNRFQDGALVGNNPSLIALQEAHQLWPESSISALVSIGTGSTPISERGIGLSSFVDTGSVLIESATSVDQVHRYLSTIARMLPRMKYFRLNPVDERCNMELDSVDPKKWRDLEEAALDFAISSQHLIENIVKVIL